MTKKYTTLLLIFLYCYTLSAQTINQYLNGIWKMECCDTDFWIINNNKFYWINETNSKKISDPVLYYCFPKILTYSEDENFNKIFKNSISIDSIDYDRPFLVNKEGIEIVYIMEYSKGDIIDNQEIKITDVSPSLNYYYINPKERNRYYVWDGTAPSKIVYFNRILTPPKYIFDFYHKIAKDRFKETIYPKIYLFDANFKKTRMYILKGDSVEIIEEKGDWFKIRYYGKSTIEGWIKKSDVE